MTVPGDADVAAVLRWINAERGMAYVLGERYPVGTEGAWRVENPADAELVLKFEPGPRDPGPLPAVLETLQRLGARGYPVPRYVTIGVHPREPVGRYALQEKLPGDEAPRIDDPLLDQILALNDLQAGMGLPETVPPGGWRHHILQPILEDATGPAAVKNTDIRRYSSETAALLESLRAYVRVHAGAPMATGDVVHFDFGKDHVWTEIVPDPHARGRVSPGKITGIIDLEGLVTGDRVFDLVTMLFYNHGPAYREGPARRMWERVLVLAAPETVGIYLAHITHRQLGGCVRWHTAESTRRFLHTTAVTWEQFGTHTGYRLKGWP
ncbi:MAG: aminoglycoside phosphotransferase family protein [Chloroflexi bacterium]|nr:aminoglycoside phosphotransferase family protein [Chloroflexota bacterium]